MTDANTDWSQHLAASGKPLLKKAKLPSGRTSNPVAELVADWAADPLAFVKEALGVAKIEPWQQTVLTWIKDGENRISVRSGHGVGKTTLEAWLILWFGTTRDDAKIGVTAPAAPQIDTALWPEIRKWLGKMREAGVVAKMLADKITVQEGFVKWENGNFAAARTARPDQPEALQGLHAGNVMIVADEASGIEEKIWEANVGAMSTPNSIQMMYSNPTRNTGYFYDTHHKLSNNWKTLRVDCNDVSFAHGHIQDVLNRYGKESNQYRVRVLGEFPLSEDDIVMPAYLLEEAVARKGKVDRLRDIAPVWGLDVAWMGSDRSALAKRCGNELIAPVKWWAGNDPHQTALRVYDEYRECNPEDRPIWVCVDVIGIGAGTMLKLRELGVPVKGINVGESAPSNERYNRLRDELWFRGREWLQDQVAIMPDDAPLMQELSSVKYRMLDNGKIKVESKDDMRKRGMRSPDLADAFLLTFAGGDHNRNAREAMQSYSTARRRPRYDMGRSWMRY